MYPEITFELFGNPIIIDVYPLFGCISIFTALLISVFMLKRVDYKIKDILVIYLLSAIFFLIGARLLNYFVNFEKYQKSGFSIFDLAFGHFSVYGGMIFAFIPPIIFNILRKKDIWIFADAITIPYLVSFAIMRMGCFLNGCCYGKACSNWIAVPAPQSKVELYDKLNKLLPILEVTPDKVYPTQLMEMGFVVIFIPIAFFLQKKYSGRGYAISLTIIYFSAFRLFVMFYRDLPYSDFVINIFYPIFYITLILTGILLFLLRLKKYSRSQTYFKNLS